MFSLFLVSVFVPFSCLHGSLQTHLILLFVFLHAIVFTSISDVCFDSGRIDGITQGSPFVFIICGSVAGVRASLEQGINRLSSCDVSVFY